MPETGDSIRKVRGPRAGYYGEWPTRIDEHVTADPQDWVQSVCVLGSTGRALDIGVRDGHIVGVRGRKDDRPNHRRLAAV
jgi:hypothetical protein